MGEASGTRVWLLEVSELQHCVFIVMALNEEYGYTEHDGEIRQMVTTSEKGGGNS